MNPLAIIAVVAGVAVLWSITKTVKAAINLTCNVTRFGIYQFANSGNLVLRLRLRIGNPTNTPITINFIDISAYIDPVVNYVNGAAQVISRGSYIASLTETVGLVIAPNYVTEKDFYINVRWVDIAKYLVTNSPDIISSITSAQGITDAINALLSHRILLQGNIKAENVNFPITQVVSMTDDRQ